MSRVNEFIKNFREFKGITQQDLAARLGKSKNVISNWERGDNSPNLDEVEKLCQIFEVTPNQLFGWDPYPAYIEYLHQREKIKRELYEKEERRYELMKQLEKLTAEIDEMERKSRLHL